MTALVVAELLAIVLLGTLVAGLLRSHAEILRRLHDAGLGGAEVRHTAVGVAEPRPDVPPANDISGTTPSGAAAAISVTEGRTLLAFLSTGCSVCAEFWQALRHRPEVPGGGRIVVVTQGTEAESPALVAEVAPPGVRVVMSSPAWQDYRVPVSPYFVLVDSGATVGEGAAATWDQVVSLLGQAVADGAGEATRDRLDRSEGALAAAGIIPGHPSLYPEGRPQA